MFARNVARLLGAPPFPLPSTLGGVGAVALGRRSRNSRTSSLILKTALSEIKQISAYWGKEYLN